MDISGTWQILNAQPLTAAAYAPYGDVIDADPSKPFKPANFGTAQRFNHLCKVQNLRPETATLNLCVFRCNPLTVREWPIEVLEKHPFSTQVFMPMHSGSYITIVALGTDKPDLSTLSAFLITGAQGISYHPGIWHHPMTAVGEQLDLACLVYEDGKPGDCVIQNLELPVVVKL